MIRTNESRLVETAALAEVRAPRAGVPYEISAEGFAANMLVGHGICYNVRVGNSAYGWVADHLEPGVTAEGVDAAQNAALAGLVCIGNAVIVATGSSTGAEGIVTGQRGSFLTQSIQIDFGPSVLEKLKYGDRLHVRTVGRGLVFEDHPEVKTLCLSPRLAAAMGLSERAGKLVVPVAAVAPSWLMGAGIGLVAERGDCDIMSTDREALAEHGLDALRLGDVVAIQDLDSRFGHCYRRGAITIGVVSHGDSSSPGHGPGVVALFTAPVPAIEPERSEGANIAAYLGIRPLQGKDYSGASR